MRPFRNKALSDTERPVELAAPFGTPTANRGASETATARSREDKVPPATHFVTTQDLHDAMAQLLSVEDVPCFGVLAQDAALRARILQTIAAVPLVPAMAQRLTEARDARPELFDHSLRMTLFALYIAIRADVSEESCRIIAAAAIFHDLGMLHVDPALMEDGRRLGPHERAYLYAHPISAYLMLRPHPEYHPAVSTAVYEHHERLDGSGYPRGIKGQEIGFHSQVLMLAEMACTLFSRSKQESVQRLRVMLKLNHQKLNSHLCSQLLGLTEALLPTLPAPSRPPLDLRALLQMDALSTAIGDVEQTLRRCQRGPLSPAQTELLDVIDSRLAALIQNLYASGYDPYAPMSVVSQFEDEPQVLQEIELLTAEALWQLVDIAHEGLRRSKNGTLAPAALRELLARVVTLMHPQTV